MTNDLQIKRRIDVVKNRMIEILRHLALQKEQGVIKSPAELQHIVYHELQSFYESIGKPNFKQIEAWGPPYSSDHNLMLEQLLTDLYTLYDEVKNMTKDIRSNYEQVELERQSFTKRISEVESLVKTISTKIKEDLDVLIFQDSFSSVDYYNREGVRGVAAYLSADNGLLTLNRIKGEEFNEYAQITIIKGDGLPGNTHVVRALDNHLKFDGEEELHINMADILDGNSDTWFEYEMFQIPQQTIDLTENKDFRYKEAVEWIRQDILNMRCVIKIDFPKARNMNWVSFLPYIPSDRGAIAATIEKIVVSDDKGEHQGLGFEDDFNSGVAYMFPRQKCKTITLYLRQDTSYPVLVGHPFFKQVNQEDTSVLDEEHLHSGIRVHGVNPSIENIGVSYDTGKAEIIYPIRKFGDTIENESIKKQNLFTAPSISATGETVLSGMEQVQAYRFMIGIRDVQLANYQFSTISQYVSVPFVSANPMKEVALDAQMEIPEGFSEGDWVQFFISIDQGRNWYPIDLKDVHKENTKTRYLFNSKTPKEGRLDEVGYIESATDIFEIQVKIELSRPVETEDDAYYTPVVYGYELQVLA